MASPKRKPEVLELVAIPWLREAALNRQFGGYTLKLPKRTSRLGWSEDDAARPTYLNPV